MRDSSLEDTPRARVAGKRNDAAACSSEDSCAVLRGTVCRNALCDEAAVWVCEQCRECGNERTQQRCEQCGGAVLEEALEHAACTAVTREHCSTTRAQLGRHEGRAVQWHALSDALQHVVPARVSCTCTHPSTQLTCECCGRVHTRALQRPLHHATAVRIKRERSDVPGEYARCRLRPRCRVKERLRRVVPKRVRPQRRQCVYQCCAQSRRVPTRQRPQQLLQHTRTLLPPSHSRHNRRQLRLCPRTQQLTVVLLMLLCCRRHRLKEHPYVRIVVVVVAFLLLVVFRTQIRYIAVHWHHN